MATKPATEKQIALITRLAAERDFAIGDTTALNTYQASTLLNKLFGAPRRQTPAAQAAPGFYLIDGSVIKVQAAQSGTGTYAKRLVIDEQARKGSWVYAPGLGAKLADSEPLTVTAAASMGHASGVCVICGRELTNPASVTAGIGPVCAGRL